MDELVEKLGYMDYRDFLAVNKYVIENHRPEKMTYSKEKRLQRVRAIILKKALYLVKEDKKQHLVQKLKNIDRLTHDELGGKDVNELKLDALMEESELAQEHFTKAYQAEESIDNIEKSYYEQLHEKFDEYFEDKEKTLPHFQKNHFAKLEDDDDFNEMHFDEVMSDPEEFILTRRYHALRKQMREEK